MTASEPPPGNLQNTLYQRVTKSQRRLTPLRLFFYRLAVRVASGLLRFLWWSWRIRVVGEERLVALSAAGAVIPCCWHQHLLVCAPYLLRRTGLNVGFLISPSVDGEVAAMFAQRMGGHVIRGSTSYTGARALRDFYLAISKQRISPLITPDGPRGPRFEFKSGALLISQLAGTPVVPLAFAARPAWVLGTWDKFVVPLPFARVVIAVGEPMVTPRVLKPEALEALQASMGASMQALYEQAGQALVRGD